MKTWFTEGVLENRPGVQKRRGRTDAVAGQLDHVHQGPFELFAARRLSVLLRRDSEYDLSAGRRVGVRDVHHAEVRTPIQLFLTVRRDAAKTL